MTNKTTKLITLLLLCSSIFFSCRKEFTEKSQTSSEPISYSDISMITGPGSEDNMEFAAQTPNPYTLPNMQAALDSLALRNELQCDITKFQIRATHKYIKFKPVDSIQFGLLIQDTSLILFDYPMDRRITKGGTYYRDPNVLEGQPNYQWTCVNIDKALPTGIPYDIISDLYIPEEDPNLIQYYNTEFDHCITLLIDEALKRTGNYDTSNYYGGMTSGGDLVSIKLPTKWTPSGRIRLSDDVLSNNTGLRGVKARAHRWFEVREQLTDANGNFNVGHQFRYPVDYSIKWERNDFNIRSGRHGQAYFNGPHQRGDWNLDIVNNNNFVSWFYGQVHRGAFDYYYNNTLGIESPPKNGFLGSRIAIGVLNKKGRAFFRKENRNWVGPEIYMYTSEEDGNGNISIPSSLRLYETIIHELAHASHFNLSHWHFRNSADMVQESWAVGVAWSFARLKYTNAMSLQWLRLQSDTDEFDVVHWGERQYTPLVIDLIDNINQRTSNGSGNTDFPIDNVTGFTIATIEDALTQRRTMDAWRDELKANKPSGVTDAQIDELFANYTPLQ